MQASESASNRPSARPDPLSQAHQAPGQASQPHPAPAPQVHPASAHGTVDPHALDRRRPFGRRAAALALGALLVTASGPALARLDGKGPFGLGIAFGEPTQLTGKVFTGRGYQNAIQFGVSWSFRNDWFGGTVDYVYEFWNVIPTIASGAIEVPIYVGIGGALWVDTHDNDRKNGIPHDNDTDFILGPRVPVGIALAWTRVPLEVFVEVAPYLFLIPDVHAAIGGQIGARWYF